MINHIVGDMLLGVKQGVIIHGCNAQGVMGSGIARIIKQKWPEVYAAYRGVHENHGLSVGDIIPVEVEPGLVIVNCITQELYGTDKRHVDYEGVAVCMESLAKWMHSKANTATLTVNTPLLGAGLAGGDWNVIEAIIDGIFTRAGGISVCLWTLPGQELLPPRTPATNRET